MSDTNIYTVTVEREPGTGAFGVIPGLVENKMTGNKIIIKSFSIIFIVVFNAICVLTYSIIMGSDSCFLALNGFI